MSRETEIRPFRVDMPDEALADLRRRIAATRWPSEELVADRSQGVQLATIAELARYWATDYDWRACEIWRTPRSWVEKSYPNVTYFNEVDKGGHFAAWEEPELFATEIRAAFRPLR
jgi:pimeloyl-ACP methyl ester carboxylesterase